MARGTIIIPNADDATGAVVEEIEHHLADRFGGYSSYSGRGGWVAGNGDLIREPHRKLVVSSENREQIERVFEACAEYVKDELDEDAVFTEIVASEIQIH
jgi:hypothetical protein